MSAKDTDVCSKLMHLEQLNKDSLGAIFRCFYKEEDLKVTHINKGEDDEGVGTNNQFNSTIIKWTVKFVSSTGGEREVTFFVKEALTKTALRRINSRLTRMTMREYFWYVEAMPILSQFYPELKHISPQCYHASTSYKRDYYPRKVISNPWLLMCGMVAVKADKGMVLLEDLCDDHRSGEIGGRLKLLDKTAIPSVQVAKVTFAAMARFHGAWWHWLNSPRDQQPCTIGALGRDGVPKALDQWNSPGLNKQNVSVGKSIEQQLRLQKKSKEVIDKWRTFWTSGYVDPLKKYFCQINKAPSRLLTIVHGDFWTSNLMYNDAEDQVVLLDFQMMKWQHPALDIWYYLCSCTDSAWRKQHLDECLDTYFQVFSGYTRQLGWDLTKQDFLDEIHARRFFCAFYAMCIVPIFFNPYPELCFHTFSQIQDFVKRRDEAVAAEAQENDPPLLTELRRRLVDMVEEAVEIGYI